MFTSSKVVLILMNIFLVFLVGCGNFNQKRKLRDYREEIAVAEKLGSDTTRIKKALSHLSNVNNEVDYAIYLTLTGIGNYKAVDSLNRKSENNFAKALEIAQELNKEGLKLWINITTAKYYYHYRKLEKALPYFLQASFKIDDIEPNDQINPAESYQYLAYVFETLEEPDKSFIYLERALELTPDNSDLKPVLLDNIGMNYVNRRDTAKAFSYFKQAEEYAILRNNIGRLARVKGNFANIYYGKSDLSTALKYINDDIKFSLIAKDSVNLVYARILKAKILFQLNNLPEGYRELNTAYEYVKSVPYLIEYRKQILDLKFRLAEQEGKVEEELLAARALYNFDKDGASGESEEAILRGKLLLNKESYLNEVKLAEVKLERETFAKKMYGILCLLIVLLAIEWYFYTSKLNKSRHEKYERKVLQFKLEKALMDQRLSEANNSVNDYLKFMTEKNEQIEELQSVIGKINQSKSAHIEERNGKLKQVLKSHLLTEENWIRFKQAFDNQYPKYYINLKKKFPDLTENNLKFILLLKLGLSTHETSNILGVSMDAVKKNKQRLKKRLQDNYEELMELI